MKKTLPILLLTLTALTIGCTNEDDATVVAIYATPSSSIVNAGDKAYIDTYITTLNSNLTHVSVTSFDSEHGEMDIFSTSPGTQEYRDKIIWNVPSMSKDTSIVEIMINATDNVNVSNELKVKIKVIAESTALLPERSGISIYSPYSGKDNAFSFTTLQPTLYSPEAEDCDIIFITTENIHEDMPRTWGTNTDIVFCKANSFDYASATWSNTQTVFNSSLRSKTVSDLQSNDTILIGREIRTEDSFRLITLGVIKIISVIDEQGTQNDRILFNIKTLNE